MKRFFALLAALLLLGACSSKTETTTQVPAETGTQEMTVADSAANDYTHFALLSFTDGGALSDGLVGAKYDEGSGYELFAAIPDLPPLEDGYFYEGWLVRQAPFESLSAGEMLSFQGDWITDFSSQDNLLDHMNYIITLEPDDGDPAPAAHVLEGTFTEL